MNRLAKISIIMLGAMAMLAIWPAESHAHGSGSIHVREMYSVLPFAARENGAPTAENQPVTDWLGMITSDLIDNYWGHPQDAFGGKTFYDYLRDEFGFKCKHRLLFHWGFNARPWNDELEKKISRLPWYSDPEAVARFKKAFTLEQASRNRRANAATEQMFGLSSSGKESAWANGIIAIVYDVHLLGDWVPDDNSDFDGVTPPSRIVGDLINALRRIDQQSSKPLEKELSAIAKSAPDEHQMAVLLIAKLQTELPSFILQSNNGALKQKFEAKGFTFK